MSREKWGAFYSSITAGMWDLGIQNAVKGVIDGARLAGISLFNSSLEMTNIVNICIHS